MIPDMFRIPKLVSLADGQVSVTHWGQTAGTLFRVADRLILDHKRKDGLLVLTPKGWGNPMFGRQEQGGLVAEPGHVPADTCRWSVAGGVAAVERDLERGGIGPGRWWIALRIETGDLTAMVGARKIFTGGWKDAAEVDELCRRAAVAPEMDRVSVAIAAAENQAQAEAMLSSVDAGRLRFTVQIPPEISADSGVVIRGPWRHLDTKEEQRMRFRNEGREFGSTMQRRVSVGGSRAISRMQMSLFGDTASLDG
jgi:hypothetical protein